MNRKLPIIFIFSGCLLLFCIFFVIVFLALPAKPVNAQCKGPTECSNCHETQAQKPVNSVGDWHITHNLFLPCNACHNGAAEAIDQDEAHTGMFTKLAEMPTQCKDCHAVDLEAKFGVYAQAKNIDPQAALAEAQKASSVTNTLSGFLGQQPAQPGAVVPTRTPQPALKLKAPVKAKPVNTTGNIILGGLLVVGLIGGGSYITWNERRLTQRPGGRTRSWFTDQIRKEHWSPYIAGVLLGITCILSVLMANKKLGASTAIASIASTLFSQAAPATANQQIYFKYLFPPGFNWEIALLAGVFLGGMLGALSSGTFKLRWNGDPTWNKIFGAQRWKRFAIGLIGAVILQYGAGIAGGCTSGLAISGGMLLAPAAFLFMAGMFASGILVALIVFRRKY